MTTVISSIPHPSRSTFNALLPIKPHRLLEIITPLIRNNPLPTSFFNKIAIKMRVPKSPHYHIPASPAELTR